MRLAESVEEMLDTVCKIFESSGQMATTFNVIEPTGDIVCVFPDKMAAIERARDLAREKCRERGAVAALTIMPFGSTDADGGSHVTGIEALLEARFGFRIFEWSVEVNDKSDWVLTPVREWDLLKEDELKGVTHLLPYSSDHGGLPDTEINIEDLFDDDFHHDTE